MGSYQTPREWEDQVHWLAQSQQSRSSWRFSIVLLGALFAVGRRVVTAWIRAARVSGDFQDFYFFLQSVGRRWKELGTRLLVLREIWCTGRTRREKQLMPPTDQGGGRLKAVGITVARATQIAAKPCRPPAWNRNFHSVCRKCK